jgi:hypothetical protein
LIIATGGGGLEYIYFIIYNVVYMLMILWDKKDTGRRDRYVIYG